MIKLPLYPEPPLAAVETTAGLPHDAECKRCPLHAGAKNVCMKAEGDAGGVLLVAAYPGRVEDTLGRPMSGATGKYLRALVKRWWKGPIAFDNAVRCAKGTAEVTEKQIDACRPYTSKVFLAARPKLVICFGGEAVHAILGRWPPINSVTRGYGFAHDALGDPVPVVFVNNPAAALRNRFVQRDFEADLLWALTEGPKLTPKHGGETNVVVTYDDAREAFAALSRREWIAYDVETYGRMLNTNFRIVSLTAGAGDTLFTWDEAFTQSAAWRPAWDLLALEGVGKVTQNGKYDDRSVLCHAGLMPSNVAGDTRLFRRLVTPTADARLAVLAELVGLGGHKHEAEAATAAVCKELTYQANPPSGLTPTGKPRKVRPPAFAVPARTLDEVRAGTEPMAFAFGHIDPTVRARYNARDVHSTACAFEELSLKLSAAPEHEQHWREVMREADGALRWVEQWGFAVDRTAILNARAFLEGSRDEALKHIALYGEINPASPAQVAELLFKKIGLPSVKETAGGAESTAKDVLDMLKGKHPVVEHILQWRHFETLRKFTDNWLPQIRDDGRLHPSFNVDGAGTGRTSSSDPNLQNIPVRSDEGTMLRRCFTASSGNVILEADFSQLELRIAAMLSGDGEMIGLFKSGVDFHQATVDMIAPTVWKLTAEQVAALPSDKRAEMRRAAKTVNFAVWYGKGEAQLAKELGLSRTEAAAVINAVLGRFRRATEYRRELVSQARRDGGVWTYWNGERARFRPLYGIADQDDGVRAHAENAAVNTPIQGSAGFYAPASLPSLVRWIRENNAPVKIIATVHDSIEFDVHPDWVHATIDAARTVMTSHYSGDVPLVVDFKVGPTWGDCEEVEEAA